MEALIAGGLSLAIALLLMPLAIVVGRRYNLGVRPRLFRRSRLRVSNLGGVAIALAALAAAGFAVGVPNIPLVLLGATLMLLVGYFDDRRKSKGGLPPALRLVVEIFVASIAWYAGLRPEITGSVLLDGFLVVFFLVAATNGINLLDNMDGVAGSTVLSIAGGVSVLALMSGQMRLAGIAAAVGGAILGFLIFNFRNARIYLGDSGSLFLGFILAGLALRLDVGLVNPWGFVVAITLFSVPALDVCVRQMSRWLAGKSLGNIQGGTDHLSHRLVKAGASTELSALLHALTSSIAGAVAIVSVMWSTPHLMGWTLIGFVVLGIGLLQVGRKYNVRPRWGRRVAAICVVAGGGALLVAIPPVLAAVQHLREAGDLLQDGVRSSQSFDSATARKTFLAAEAAASKAEREMTSPLTFGAKLFPVIRQNLQQLEDISSGAVLFSLGAHQASDALEYFADSGEKPSIGIHGGKVDLAPLLEAAPQLREAAEWSRLGMERLNTQRAFLVPSVSRAKELVAQRAAQAHQQLGNAANLAEVLPKALGSEEPKRWFLAIQNGAEMRATGGLIGAFGILKAEGGQLSLERMDPDRNLPVVGRSAEAETELLAHLGRFAVNADWRNVNMTPDFPSAARMILGLWEGSTGEQLDGVVAIDGRGMASLMEAVGPIRMEGIQEEITSENFVKFTLGDAYALYPRRAERQDVLVETAKATWQKLLSSEFRSSEKFTKSLASAASKKHILVWSPESEGQLSELGLTGRLGSSPKSDYLQVVGQNAAANKIDLYAQREIRYQVDLRAAPKAHLDVQMSNDAPKSGLPAYVMGPEVLDGTRGFNRSYVSVYSGVQGLIGATINGKVVGMESHKERGLSVFSNFMVAKPGASSVMSMDLAVVPQKPGEYRLVVQKQPTVNADRLRLEIKLPAGSFVIQSTPGMTYSNGRVVWSGVLDSDKEFVVQYGDSLGDRLKNVFDPTSKLAANSTYGG